MVLGRTSESGSAIVMLFIAVALFGAVTYALMASSRTSTSWLKAEESKAAATGYIDCANAESMAQKRLSMRGCGTMISSAADGSNTIPGAPTDGSCSIYHVNGGGVKPCVSLDPETQCGTKTLSVGQLCDGMVYAGISPDGGKRMFTTPADTTGVYWNNSGNVTPVNVAGTTVNGGAGNTALIVALDADSGTAGFQYHESAKFCDDLVAFGRSDWYLPARGEVQVLYNGRVPIGGFSAAKYQSSSQGDQYGYLAWNFSSGFADTDYKYNPSPFRCVRKEP